MLGGAFAGLFAAGPGCSGSIDGSVSAAGVVPGGGASSDVIDTALPILGIDDFFIPGGHGEIIGLRV